ncbi:MAG: hypothetical protein ACRYGA_02480 [Janthinobacterium lividum]
MSGFRLINGRYVIDKRQRSALDYGIRLKPWLVEGDGISSSSQAMWTVSDGLTLVPGGTSIVQDPARGPIAYVKVAGGGADGTQEWARCVWTTDQGRVEELTMFFNMTTKASAP